MKIYFKKMSDLIWTDVNNVELENDIFSFAGISAGLKDSSRKDLALILAPKDSICSGFFTQSIVRASCINICEERINNSSGLVRAILINSGQANACTGELGMKDSLLATKELARLLGIKEDQVLICSTGVIGVPIPISNLMKHLPALVDKLNENNFYDASEAILTTDLVPKRIAIETLIEGRRIKISAIAKGSGMIYPNMATMLAFLTCDVGIEKNIWDSIIYDAVQTSFNAITVDGETSTNDAFIAINSGENLDHKYLNIIKQGVNYACQTLAKSIARDGEGANCLLEVVVEGASNDFDALKIARSITNSPLVKTAINGSDPNWGRIISAAGNSGVEFVLDDFDLLIGPYEILKKGKLIKFDKALVKSYMRLKMNGEYLVDDTLQITINLNSGYGKGKSWGCDLSKKYIEINSEYTT